MKIDLDLMATTFTDVEFFVACVGADAAPAFSCPHPSSLAVTNDPNFWAVTSRVRSTGQSLVNQVGFASILFRGYEAGLSVHSYSAAAERERLAAPDKLTNGVFAYLKFDCTTKQAVIRSDAFGVAPLFYRRSGAAWLFGSHPGLLHFTGDQVDLNAWLSMLQSGQMLGEQSFYSEIARFPAGTQMTINGSYEVLERWFSFAELPYGNQPIDDSTFETVENAYRSSMDRCLRLDLEEKTLPLSSGYDSRRFLGTLVQRNVAFHAVTCQTFHRKNGRDYDIDAHFAPKMAAAFGVPCELIAAVPIDCIAGDVQRREALIGTETFDHDWAVPLMRWLGTRPPSMVFDGLGGDTFGNSGFEINGLHESPEKDVDLLVNHAAKPYLFRLLSSRFLRLAEYKATYRNYLVQFPSNLNRAELAFLQSRTRRGISPWITMMHPPGHVVVFPYFDIEFAQATLSFHPAEKYKWFLQKECLRRWYPDFFDFPGTRNLPKDYAPLPLAISLARKREVDGYLYGELSTIIGSLRYLSLPNKVLLILAKVFPILRKRLDWLFKPLLSLVTTKRHAKVFLEREVVSSAKGVS